ncbi:type II and III secretion system protein family protein [Desulfosediminicola ganghwensis]|uniref:type II and III secretion system protein family protein n=1 Tax=Desulfosediminicola ganghwensis TaxID=2569540 RepID=UPI0010AC6784|nr:type II and III secretion system protein family protein [Desulfosediminicola ganghwensis]
MKSTTGVPGMVGVCAVALVMLCSIWTGILPPASIATAAEIEIDTKSGKPINLQINKLGKIKSPWPVARAHVVDPEIAELVYSKTQSPYWVFVSGKSAGTTQLTLWGEKNRMLGTYEVIVSADTTGLKKTLYEIFPNDDISVRSSGGYLTLTGTVSDSMKLSKVLTLAEAYAPEKVINLLQVGGLQQVMLEVRIAEISKTTGKELGVNFAWEGDDNFALSLLDNLTAIPEDGWPGNPIEVSSSVNSVLGFVTGDTLIVAIDALQEDGLMQILAKPTLIAQSGQNASFLAGGEFPYPVADGIDSITFEWKPFGIGLNFTPTVLGNDTISMVVSPEVSDLDFSTTVSYAGYVVPAIETRRMSTVVELKDGQSFAVAGLLKDYVSESIAKFPILGDIPILGALFRSTKYQKDETELVVIVTPHLVKPVDGDELPLPTDSFVEPNTFELLMLGMMEKPQWSSSQSTASASTDLDVEGAGVSANDFGYILPE